MTNRNDYGAGTAGAPPYSNTVGENVGSGASSVLGQSSTGALTGLSATGQPQIPLGLSNPRGKHIFIGDSLTFQGSGRASSIFNGTLWRFATSIVTTNLGGSNNWVIDGMIQATATTASSSLLRTDGNGYLQYAYNGDSYGPLVNAAKNGGWILLNSGSPGLPQLLVRVRGATVPPTVAGSGAVTCSGNPVINDWNPMGFVTWVAGALSDTFSDYECWGITGSTTSDILKFTPQVLAGAPNTGQRNIEAVTLLCGINDASTVSNAATGEAMANKAFANIVNIIALCQNAGVRRIYVGDIFPYPGAAGAAIQQYATLLSTMVKAYCRITQGCVFWSAWDMMSSPTSAAGNASRTGVFNPADNLHLMPYGAYVASTALVPLIKKDYSVERGRKVALDVYDSVLNIGCWNTNPTLRGTAGTVTGGGNITGTAPDGWTLQMVAGSVTQTCTSSFVAASDLGSSYYTLTVAAATLNDAHDLLQVVNVPAGVSVGSYFRITSDQIMGAMANSGLAIYEIFAVSNGNIQSAFLMQFPVLNRNIATFAGTENAELKLQSEPMQLVTGVTSFTLRIRLGADPVGGSTGTISYPNIRIESCPGPIYP